MNPFIDLITERLAETLVTKATFDTIVYRLQGTGTLSREESATEGRLYDEAVRIEPLLHDFFEITGFRLKHNSQHRYFRLYPPADNAEGEAGDAARRLRQHFSKDFTAYVLALRHLYQQSIDSGTLNELAEYPVSIADLVQAMRLLLKREPPKTKATRLSIYRELSVQNLVRLPEGFEHETDELLIAVRPPILDFVTEAQLNAVRLQIASRRSGGICADATLQDSLVPATDDDLTVA